MTDFVCQEGFYAGLSGETRLLASQFHVDTGSLIYPSRDQPSIACGRKVHIPDERIGCLIERHRGPRKRPAAGHVCIKVAAIFGAAYNVQSAGYRAASGQQYIDRASIGQEIRCVRRARRAKSRERIGSGNILQGGAEGVFGTGKQEYDTQDDRVESIHKALTIGPREIHTFCYRGQ